MINRNLLAVAFMSLAMFIVLGFKADSAPASAAKKFSVSIKFTFGKRTSTGGCGPGRGLCEIKLGTSVATAGAVGGLASPINDQKLECVFQGKLPDGGSTFTVDRDIQLETAIAQKLGFKSLTIISGEYGVAASKGSFGGVELNVRTTK